MDKYRRRDMLDCPGQEQDLSEQVKNLTKDLATARSALAIATAVLVQFRGFPCRTCRRDADANHALTRLAALTPATGEPT